MNATTQLEAGFVKEAACGSWLTILRTLAPALEQSLNRPGRHNACPVHGGKNGFKVFKDVAVTGGGLCNTCGAKADGFSLLMWLNGWSFPDTLEQVAGAIGLSSLSTKVIKPKKLITVNKPLSTNNEWLIKLLRDTWQQSCPINHPDATPARLYFKNRGLDADLINYSALRFHPGLQYKNQDGIIVGDLPCLLALVAKEKEAITLHRTYLTFDGSKALVDSPRKMMPIPLGKQAIGSAIPLGKPGRVLNVAEGLETALAVTEATGMITWSVLSASFMSGFKIPDGVEKLIIWADKDRLEVGFQAALKLHSMASKLGVEAVINLPKTKIPADKKSVDWLDVLKSGDLNQFAVRSCSEKVTGGLL